MTKVAQHFVGIDLHQKVVQICVMDQDGEIVKERRMTCHGAAAGREVIRYLSQWRRDGSYVVEALGLNRWLVNGCREAGLSIIVADPRHLDLRKSGKKTDRRDARELARRLRNCDLERHARTYYPSEAEYGERKVLRVRRALQKMRQMAINQIRALLRAYQLCPPEGSLFSALNQQWLREVALPTADHRLVLQTLVSTLQDLQSRIRHLDERIAELATAVDVAPLVKLLPGVGALTAVTLVRELGELRRFAGQGARAVASYVGLVPRVMQSADHSHHGRLTKAGNSELRWILNQWAVRLLARDPLVGEWARPRLKRMHKNKVRTALARRLLIGVYVVLSRGEVFEMSRCLGLPAR